MQKYLLLIICFCTAISACKKDTEDETVFTRKDFPATAGSYWTYAYTSQYQQQAEYKATLTHRIERVEDLSADSQVIHYTMYMDSKFLDSAVGILCNTGFTYLGTAYKGSSSLGDFHLDLPFYPDKSWVSTDSFDTLKVVYQAASYALQPDNYRDVFYLYNKYLKGNKVSENEILIAKGVGVVVKSKMRQGIEWYGEDAIEEFKLISYHIQ